MTGILNDVSTDQAQEAIAAGRRRSRELDLAMNLAVVDSGGNLKAFARMDDAWLGSIDISIKKARTARYFDMPTADLSPMVQPGEPLYHIEFSNGELITFPGGIPLTLDDGSVIGAVGVSGSTVDNDQAVAEAAAEVIS